MAGGAWGRARGGSAGRRARRAAGDDDGPRWLHPGAFLERSAEPLVAAAVVGVVASMLVPLPPSVLDVLLSGSLSLAVLMLALALQVRTTFDLSAFPTLLLLTTLFRLALEISATRLVLLHGHAGAVIHAFGRLVVGGNLVVGAVVFLILTLVQYVVITKGAERVAEVAARFTLDGMPGKQMAIDADLRAGSIDLEGARHRRAELDRQVHFFGAMDGAIKFVRGDAVAGLVIVAVNIVGGLAIGLGQRGMSLEDALRTYALLTIGGGLVAGVPALVISVAAGIVVTRTATSSTSPGEGAEGGGHPAGFGAELLRQLGQQPKAIAVAGGLLLALALVPGLPTWPFALLGAASSGLAARQARVLRGRRADAREVGAEPIVYRVSRSLALVGGPRAAPASGDADGEGTDGDRGDLTTDAVASGEPREPREPRAAALVASLSRRLGLSLPRLDLSRSPARPTLEDAARIGGGSSGTMALRIDGIVRAVVPIPEGPSSWLETATNLLAGHAWQVVSVDDSAAWLERWRRTHPALVREVVPRVLSLGRLNQVLRGLVRDGVSLGAGLEILESLATLEIPAPADPAAVVEHVRSGLGAALVAPHLDAEGRLPVVELEAQIEDALRDGIRQVGRVRQLALEPSLAEDVVGGIGAALREAVPAVGAPPAAPVAPVLLTHGELRRHLHQLIEGPLPGVAVVAYGELPAALVLFPVARARVFGPPG
jgi:type III secretory pathway component EscV